LPAPLPADFERSDSGACQADNDVDQPRFNGRQRRFPGEDINSPANLTEAQLNRTSCVRCGDEHSHKRPVAPMTRGKLESSMAAGS
jgi:hypothetical protein